MFRSVFFLPALLAISLFAPAQDTDYKVVFDITSNDATAQQQVIRDAGLIKDAHPDAQVEIVLYGQALDLVEKDKSTQSDAVQRLIGQKVQFKACAIAMKHHQVDPSQLIPGVGIVPDGIYEIISKQKEGYGYIKIAR